VNNNPFTPRDLPPGRLGTHEEQIMSFSKQQSPTRPRRAHIAIAVGVATLAFGTAAGAYVLNNDVAEQAALSGTGCYNTADLESDVAVLQYVSDPIEACTELWEEGAMIIGVTKAPPLTACAKNGAVQVYPSETANDATVCAKLGATPLPPGYRLVAESVIDAIKQIENLNHEPGCVPTEDFAVEVQAIIDEAQLDHWKLHVIESSVDRPCSAVVVSGDLGDERRIVISAIPEVGAVEILGQVRDATNAKCFKSFEAIEAYLIAELATLDTDFKVVDETGNLEGLDINGEPYADDCYRTGSYSYQGADPFDFNLQDSNGGDLVPSESLIKIDIQSIEVWQAR